ncbi:hypothetical protein [Bacillus sp. 95MFCvi2.1]|uniref:hypothetical protein n=1 Tax=Bacillus sp. 95MFCvi2.1 TaxID=1151121 RepID=UPI000376A08A|nr:hypothetical protein [Bacillus sp. 95MFCvi2.1]
MKRMIASICVAGSLLIAPIQSFAEVKTGGNQQIVVKDGWVFEQNNWYYYVNNVPASGWKKIQGTWYYFESNGVMKTGWYFDGTNWFYMNSNGGMETGWKKIQGTWYYFESNGVMKTDWYFDGMNWFYMNSNGGMETGWKKIQGTWYYFESNGVMKTDWYFDGTNWFYMNSNGGMEIGWNKIGGAWYYFENSGVWVASNDADYLYTIGENQQLILVTANDYGTSKAEIQTFEKRNNKWYPVYAAMQGYIGRDGFAYTMAEGGKNSPRGKYTIGTAFGRYGNPGTKLPYRQITSNDVWVDDSNSPLYNTWQQKPANDRWSSAENMNIPQYDYGFVINYNTERIAGAGSAIFFHISDMYTYGCTATSRENALSVLRWLNPAKSPVIVQTPESELKYY